MFAAMLIIGTFVVVKVTKGGEFKANKKDENENIQYYAGSENQLAMTRCLRKHASQVNIHQIYRFYNQRFLCDYKMAWSVSHFTMPQKSNNTKGSCQKLGNITL